MIEGLKIIMDSAMETAKKIINKNELKTIEEVDKADEYFNQPVTAALKDIIELAGALCNACAAADVLDSAKSARGYYTPRKIHTSADGKVTVIFWEDGEKTIVRLSEGDMPNAQNAFTNALAKKIFGSNSQIKRIIEAKTEVQKPKKKKKHTLPESTLSTSAPTPAETMLSHIVDYGCDN